MEHETLPYKETTRELISKLRVEREKKGGGNIYQIARRICLLRLRDQKENLTTEENARLWLTFLHCRKGKDFLPEHVEHPYQLAIMFMLANHFFPKTAPILEEEKKELLAAANEMAKKKEYKKLVTFLETCASFKVDASTPLSKKQMEKVANEMAVSS